MKMVKIVILLLIIAGGFFYHSRKSRSADLNIKEGTKVENIVLNAKIKTSKGEINLKLYPEATPITVTNFVHLARKGYYDGLKFHRVIADFMIQGGDPDGTGAGGPGYTIPDEFSNDLHFNKMGVLAMANRGPNTGGSQFFITLGPTDWLDNKHTIFGTVVQGMDVVEKIGKVKTGRNDKPVEPVIINSITLEPITDDAKNGK